MDRKGKRKKTAKIFGLVYMWIVTFVVTVQTFNCFVLYHCSSFAELNGIPTEQHTRTELEALGNKLVTEINALSKEVERDSEGKFVLTADLDKTAQEAMRGLGSEFKNLGGFYVTPKAIKCSFFMSQMDLMGIYFPFSMEANYNQDMYKAILTLKTVEECMDFFDDLCTVTEIQAMEQRYQVAVCLSKGMIYNDILAETGASSATISRVNRSLQYGKDGYEIVFERLADQKEED